MPTWASRIMLTSLAPSPMERVMGFPLEFFTIFTICDAQGKNTHWEIKQRKKTNSLLHYFNKDRLSISSFWPAPSEEEPSGSTAQLCSFGTSAGRGSYSGWRWAPLTAWPRQWWSRSPCQQTTSFLNTAVKKRKNTTVIKKNEKDPQQPIIGVLTCWLLLGMVARPARPSCGIPAAVHAVAPRASSLRSLASAPSAPAARCLSGTTCRRNTWTWPSPSCRPSEPRP